LLFSAVLLATHGSLSRPDCEESDSIVERIQ